jgi:hypothetical protein
MNKVIHKPARWKFWKWSWFGLNPWRYKTVNLIVQYHDEEDLKRKFGFNNETELIDHISGEIKKEINNGIH